MRMSPDSSNGTRSAMLWSTTAAGTISQIARGLSSCLTRFGERSGAEGLLPNQFLHRLGRPIEHHAGMARFHQAGAPYWPPSGPVRSFRVALSTPSLKRSCGSRSLRVEYPAGRRSDGPWIWVTTTPTGSRPSGATSFGVVRAADSPLLYNRTAALPAGRSRESSDSRRSALGDQPQCGIRRSVGRSGSLALWRPP